MKTRLELAQTLFRGRGAELGVAWGEYSDAILRCRMPLKMERHMRTLDHPHCVDHLHSIDRWTEPHHDIREYARALDRLRVHGERSTVLRASFAEARVLFAEASLDFIYIDGYAHTGQDGGQTLADWWPVLKPGGIFAGHDYDPQFQPTIAAVDAFVQQHSLTLNLTQEPVNPSWWILKP